MSRLNTRIDKGMFGDSVVDEIDIEDSEVEPEEKRSLVKATQSKQSSNDK